MIDHDSVHLAFRNRLRTLSIATTGVMNLSRTADAYVRADGGSFITDDFAVGMEILPVGFPTNERVMVASVSQLSLGVDSVLSVAGAAAGRSLTAELPETRIWENMEGEAVPGRPFIEEDYVPGTHGLIGASHVAEETGLYIIRWYGLRGQDMTAIRRSVQKVLRLFLPGYAVWVGGYVVVRVRSDPAPTAGQILPAVQAGWAVCTVTIPWKAESLNT